MKIEKKTKEIKREIIYSDQELADFDKELESHKTKGIMPDGREIMYIAVGGEFAYLKSKGIIKSWQEIDKTIKAVSLLPAWRLKLPEEMFEEHQNKMRQYWKLKSKGDYIFQKNIEDYEKVAKSFPPILEESEFPNL